MNPAHYATYFDQHYLPRGLALYRSLERHCRPFVLWVLCLDRETELALERLQLDHVRRVSLKELETADSALLAVRNRRSPVEYYWTCGPAFLLYLFEHECGIETLTYVDADLYFYADPTPIHQEFGASSILVIEPRHVIHALGDPQRTHSRFNVGLLMFRRRAGSLTCLRRWREQCLDWCFDRREGDRYGDQGYLTDWPEQFDGVTVSQHLGVGVAPWNIRNHPVTVDNGQVMIASVPLVFFHFSGLRRISRWLYEMHVWRLHENRVPPVVRWHIYGPYIRELHAAERRLRALGLRFRSDVRGSQRTFAWNAERRALVKHVPYTNLTRYQRFMFVAGPLAL